MSVGMNQVVLVGRVAGEPKHKDCGVTEFVLSVALPTKKGMEPKYLMIDCDAWRDTLKGVVDHIRRTRKIGVIGTLDFNSFVEDGKKRWRHKILVRFIELMDGKDTGKNDEPHADNVDIPDEAREFSENAR